MYLNNIYSGSWVAENSNYLGEYNVIRTNRDSALKDKPIVIIFKNCTDIPIAALCTVSRLWSCRRGALRFIAHSLCCTRSYLLKRSVLFFVFFPELDSWWAWHNWLMLQIFCAEELLCMLCVNVCAAVHVCVCVCASEGAGCDKRVGERELLCEEK